VLGAYFVLHPRARVLTVLPILFIPLFFWVPAVLFLLIWFLTQLLESSASGLTGGGVAWWAHIGGFVAGALLHRLFLHQRPAEEVVRSVRPRW
jgi:membrane associated rhomboid family serine protease